MNDQPATIAEGSKLNPLALPAETDARFILLSASAVALCLVAGITIGMVLDPLAYGSAAPGTVSSDIRSVQGMQAVAAASARQHLWRLPLPGLLTLLVFGLAVWHYRTHPARLERNHRLQPLSLDADPKLWQKVHRLTEVAGIEPAPKFAIGPNLRSCSGQAYGLRGRPRVRLDGGLRLYLRKQPAAFRAVLLHELGHHANGDVLRSTFAQSLWQVTVVVAVAPTAAMLGMLLLQAAAERLFGSAGNWQTLLTVSLPTYGAIWLRGGSIVLLALGTRASLLRVREYYADWRAAQWGALPGLQAILRRQEEPPLAGWNRLRRWLRLHPTSDERLTVLEDSGRLFRLAPDLPFVVGWLVAILGIAGFETAGDLAAGVGYWVMAPATNALAAAGANQNYWLLMLALGLALVAALLVLLVLLLPVWGISLLMTRALGLQAIRDDLWRRVMQRGASRRFLRSLQTAAVWLLGFELGVLSIPLREHWSPFVSLSAADAGRLALMGVWWAGAIGLVGLWLWGVQRTGGRQLGRSLATRPQGLSRSLMLPSSGPLWLFFLSLTASRILILIDASGTDRMLLIWVSLLSLGIGLGLWAAWIAGSWLVWRRRRAADTF